MKSVVYWLRAIWPSLDMWTGCFIGAAAVLAVEGRGEAYIFGGYALVCLIAATIRAPSAAARKGRKGE